MNSSAAQTIAQARIVANAQNKVKAVELVGKCLALLNEGGTDKQALGLFGRDERKRLKSYAQRHGKQVGEIFVHLVEGSLTIGELAEGIFTDAGRQSDGEKHFHNELVRVVNEQNALRDGNGSLVHKLPGGFLNNGPTGSNWKGLDFHISSFGIHELISHKYTNGKGGSQTNSNHELLRLVTASSPYTPKAEIKGDWPQHHYPEAVEVYLRGKLAVGGASVNGIILAGIQDGVGRVKDIELMQKIAQASLYQGSPLVVFAGSREQYFLARPLLFILTRGWNSFTTQQQEELIEQVGKFYAQYPQGLAGLYANPSTPWEVLEKID